MSEFRQDRMTGAWVLIASKRGQRPRAAKECRPASQPRPAYDPACPFCPGNEHRLPGIIEQTPSDEPPGWITRVVPNKYPALRPDTDATPANGTHQAVPGYGQHEVIIETGRHDSDVTDLPAVHVAEVIQTFRRRYRDLMATPGIEAVIIFRNRGPLGGASLAHPHSQVIATGLMPPRMEAAAAWARAYFEREDRCATCAALTDELKDGARAVEATDGFLVLVPYAAETPFEQRIIPRHHECSFGDVEDAALVELARLLQRALRRLAEACDDPPYNLVIESGGVQDQQAGHMHWGIRILPRLTRPGGFELGTGIPINPSRPEDDAEALRAAPVTARAEPS